MKEIERLRKNGISCDWWWRSCCGDRQAGPRTPDQDVGNREQGNQPESTERRFFEGSQDERLPQMPLGDPELSGWPSPHPRSKTARERWW